MNPAQVRTLLAAVALALLGTGLHEVLSATPVQGPPSQDTAIRTIGVLHGDRNQVFGRIRDIEADESGNVLVLDDQNYSVSWFGPEGTFRGAVGREGGGPGEFSEPVGMALAPDDRVYVLDAGRPGVAVFELAAGGLAYMRDFPVPVFGSDICLLDGEIAILGQVPSEGLAGLTVHVMSLNGQAVRSFGPLLRPEIEAGNERFESLLVSLANRGRIHCTADLKVVTTSEQLGIVRLFSRTGELLLHHRVPGFSPVTWEATRGGGLTMSVDRTAAVAHTLTYVTEYSPTEIILTVSESRVSSLSQHDLLTACVDPRTGTGTAPKTADITLAARVGGYVYGFANNPFPHVSIRDMSGQRDCTP